MAIVLGYHGCDKTTAQALLGGSPFQVSDKPYDWLGEGAYFWEWDPVRAYEWALERRPLEPCIVGAAIDLGHCLDLTTQTGIRAVRRAYDSFERLRIQAGKPPLVNKDGKNSNPGDRVVRLLDRAVVDHLHATYKAEAKRLPGKFQEFDTVRALFPEGEELYPTAGFRQKTHVQLSVKRIQVIGGVFRVPTYELVRHRLPVGMYS